MQIFSAMPQYIFLTIDAFYDFLLPFEIAVLSGKLPCLTDLGVPF